MTYRKVLSYKISSSPCVLEWLTILDGIISSSREDYIVCYKSSINGNSYLNGEFCSWRGCYSDVAINYSSSSKDAITVKEFRDKLKSYIGTSQYGYKGGEYLVTEKTDTSIDNVGDYSGSYITEIEVDDESKEIIVLCEYD